MRAGDCKGVKATYAYFYDCPDKILLVAFRPVKLRRTMQSRTLAPARRSAGSSKQKMELTMSAATQSAAATVPQGRRRGPTLLDIYTASDRRIAQYWSAGVLPRRSPQRSRRQRQKLCPLRLVVLEITEHGRGDRFFACHRDAARFHAHVAAADDHPDRARLEMLHQ